MQSSIKPNGSVNVLSLTRRPEFDKAIVVRTSIDLYYIGIDNIISPTGNLAYLPHTTSGWCRVVSFSKNGRGSRLPKATSCNISSVGLCYTYVIGEGVPTMPNGGLNGLRVSLVGNVLFSIMPFMGVRATP
jgi:hypothetical protein